MARGAEEVPRRDGDAASCRSCVFPMTNSLARLTAFFVDVREELKQVTWPTREELIGSALVVFVGVVCLSSFIGACNFILSRVAQVLLR